MFTTLCYIENNDSMLMLLRNKKKNDQNANKWIGIGGKFESQESPEECVIREVFEETSLRLIDLKFRGIVTFVLNDSYTEYMFLFSSNKFEGTISECNEGTLKWINKSELYKLPMWEGDKIFLDCLEKNIPFFSLKLTYRDDVLVEAKLNNEKIR